MAGRKSLDSRRRTMAETASAVGSMLLFVLFALCMLMAVAVAADTYSRIKNGYQQSLGTAASIKIRFKQASLGGQRNPAGQRCGGSQR